MTLLLVITDTNVKAQLKPRALYCERVKHRRHKRDSVTHRIRLWALDEVLGLILNKSVCIFLNWCRYGYFEQCPKLKFDALILIVYHANHLITDLTFLGRNTRAYSRTMCRPPACPGRACSASWNSPSERSTLRTTASRRPH